MKRLTAAILMVTAAATVCHADGAWQYVRSAPAPDSNLNIEVQVASIETISPTLVRALTRYVRKNLDQTEWSFGTSTHSIESLVDFDCNKSKFEIIQLVTVNLSGDKTVVNIESAPTFEAVEHDSLLDGAQAFVCKQGRMLK